ncbi:hypothetical protein GLP22_08405 [Photobacterium carnosum]|uniref:hypothetical protein n=1 Tax=Photobacterium carnosum TaxID=2023717 RepID=UPI001E2FD933|nr:hypothetical protein [Photobacterium carnosum]MCD9541227.1 hypothetical protein [Photobacterium carnosum]
MGDYQDFCESNGGCASDPDFMDNWLSENCHEESTSSFFLKNTQNKEIEYKAIKTFNYTSIKNEYELTELEIIQIKQYMDVFVDHKFIEQKEVNNFITEKKGWGEFSEIRSMNDHGEHKNIPGILPKFYSVTCAVLNLTRGNGAQLTKATKY